MWEKTYEEKILEEKDQTESDIITWTWKKDSTNIKDDCVRMNTFSGLHAPQIIGK